LSDKSYSFDVSGEAMIMILVSVSLDGIRF